MVRVAGMSLNRSKFRIVSFKINGERYWCLIFGPDSHRYYYSWQEAIDDVFRLSRYMVRGLG